jgi:transmembrane sensor
MDSEHKYKAEDFLSNQIPPEKESLMSDHEKKLAGHIRSAIKDSGNEKMSAMEKDVLWAEIQSSATLKSTSLNWKLYLQAAAVLVLAFGIGLWQYQRHTSTNKLLTFAAQNINKKIVVKKLQGAEKGKNAVAENSNEDENIITAIDFNTLVVGDGQRSVIHLPDGTNVWLNSGSRLIYPASFAKDSREVYLEGEAYFDVAHNKEWPFYVRAKNMEIKVLGTEFFVSSNVESKSNYAVLVNGSIAFSTGNWLNKMERELVPGQQINFNAEQHELLVSNVNTAEFKSWKDGYVAIQSESLDVIVQRVAKYYHMEISTEGLDLSNEKFTGPLYFQRSADDVLNTLCQGTPYIYNGAERRLELRKR